MEPTLKKLEAMAGTKKRPFVFNIPMTTEENEIKMRNGNMITVSNRVSSTFPETASKSASTRRRTTCSEKMIPRSVTKLNTIPKKTKTLPASSQVARSPFFVS